MALPEPRRVGERGLSVVEVVAWKGSKESGRRRGRRRRRRIGLLLLLPSLLLQLLLLPLPLPLLVVVAPDAVDADGAMEFS